MILYDWLVVQCAHLEKYESSMGRMTSQTTNQMRLSENGLSIPK